MSALLYDLVECPELSGNLYVPKQPAKGGVLLLHGSEGGGFGVHDRQAQMLAAHGFVTFAFTWCGSAQDPMPGVPGEIVNIDLGRTMAAFRWLKNRPELVGKRVALWGVSRGAEQALILAAMSAEHPEIPKPDAVAVLAASDTIVAGYSWSWFAQGGLWATIRLWSGHARAWHWQDRDVGPIDSPITIERYDGPVLLAHGNEDSLWPVTRSHRLEERLRAAHRPVETQYLPHEEHVLSIHGQHVHREKLVEFFERTLRVSEG
jgi:dipeptidyl aminopeptidase/acylaminoacyl peptidase